MTMYGILADVNWCTGCEACILACQQEHNYGVEESGIRISTDGPVILDAEEKIYQYDFVPSFNASCDLCGERVGKGKVPTCVQHCQAQCLEWGPVDELRAKVENDKMLVVEIKEM